MPNKIAKVIFHEAPGRVGLRDCPLEPLKDGEVLLETLYSAISPGTELRCLRGEQPGAAQGPYVPGYQSIGRIIEVGPNCRKQAGEVVFNGNGSGYGDHLAAMWGGHSSHIVTSESSVVDLPEGIRLEEAALAKLTAVALHGLKTGKVNSGERVAVIGLGALGQLSMRLAMARGAEVYAFDRNGARTANARAFGANAITVCGTIEDAATQIGWPEKEFDAILDVTGVPKLVDEFINLTRDVMPWNAPVNPGTRYVIQGSYSGNVSFDYSTAFMKELSFFFPRDNTGSDTAEALEYIASGKLQMESIINKPVPPNDAPDVYNDLSSGESTRLTAVFDWSQLA